MAAEETFRDLLSMSEAFLREVRAVDSVFQGSKVACLGLPANIMVVVNKGAEVNATEANQLVRSRSRTIPMSPS